jgi:uncharacterized protein
MDAIKIDYKVFLLCLAGVGVLELLAGYAGGSGEGIHPLELVGLVRTLEIALILIIVISHGQGLPSLGLAPHGLWPGVKRGMLWSACFGMVAVAAGSVLLLAGMNPAMFSAQLPGGLNNRILFFLVGGVVGPLAEEVFFRGVCYGFFRRWGRVTALIFTTLLFVSAHAMKTGVPLTQIVGGVVFALAYEFEKSLMVPIVIHILGNLALFTIAML